MGLGFHQRQKRSQGRLAQPRLEIRREHEEAAPPDSVCIALVETPAHMARAGWYRNVLV
jgi:hypothetical protein